MVDYGWCNRAEMVDLSGIGRVELNGWDIVGRAWKSCIEYGSARNGGGGYPKDYGDIIIIHNDNKINNNANYYHYSQHQNQRYHVHLLFLPNRSLLLSP